MEIIYKCGKHEYQKVERMILPHFTFELECGCVFAANMHGSWYRLMTTTCDICDRIIEGICFIEHDYSTKFYHIECAKNKFSDSKLEGKLMDIEEYYKTLITRYTA